MNSDTPEKSRRSTGRSPKRSPRTRKRDNSPPISSAELATLSPAHLATISTRSDPTPWIPFDHLLLINDRVQAAFAGEINRLIIEAPPQHGKSEFVSRWVPTWWLTVRPKTRVILTSYEADFAASWGRKVRQSIEAQEGRFGIGVAQSSAAAHRWDLFDKERKKLTGGGMNTAGVMGPITGKGGDLIVIDDPVKNHDQALSTTFQAGQWDWYRSVLRTRTRKGAVIILIMTRWVQDDLAGRLKDEEEKGGEPWEILRLPALAEPGDPLGREEGEALCPELRPLDELLAQARSLGSFWAAALLQQRPSPAEGGIFKRAWFRHRWKELPELDEEIISVDCAFKETKTSSFVVFQTWGRKGAEKFLIDQVRARMDFPTTKREFKAFCQKHPNARRKLIEAKANGPAIIDELKRVVAGMIPVEPKGSKEARAHAVAPTVEAGNVWLPESGDWVSAFVEEAANFPNKPDDQVDAMTQALDHLTRGVRPGIVSLRRAR